MPHVALYWQANLQHILWVIEYCCSVIKYLIDVFFDESHFAVHSISQKRKLYSMHAYRMILSLSLFIFIGEVKSVYTWVACTNKLQVQPSRNCEKYTVGKLTWHRNGSIKEETNIWGMICWKLSTATIRCRKNASLQIVAKIWLFNWFILGLLLKCRSMFFLELTFYECKVYIISL